MLIGMFCAVFVTAAAVTVSPSDRPARRPDARHRRHAPPQRPPARSLPVAPGEVYSLRARRRFAAYLRLRLLELREAGLERAANVIERRLPADTLVPPPHRPPNADATHPSVGPFGPADPPQAEQI